jgi:hypothetical protein
MTGATVVLALLIPISLVGEHGLDWFDITKPGDLTLERAFEASAPSGSILTWIGFGPYVQDSTYRYTELGSLEYDDLVNLPTPTKPTNPLTPAQSIAYLPTYIKSQDPREPDQIYAVVSITLQEQGLAYGQYSIAQYQAVAREMASSPQWELLLRTSTGALYRERS